MAVDQPTPTSSSTRSDTFTRQSIASASANDSNHASASKASATGGELGDHGGSGIQGELRDDARLSDLGYKPELRRNFSNFETFGVAFSIM